MAEDDTGNPFVDTDGASARMDGWANEFTGVGHDARTRFNFGVPIRLTDDQLERLYYGDPYAARACDCVPEEAMRRGLKFRLDFGDKAGAKGMHSRSGATGGDAMAATALLHKKFDEHHGAQKTREAWTWGRVWGGGFLLLGVNDGQAPTEPLDLKAAKEFLFVASCDKTELQPIKWYENTEARNFGEPELYQLTRQAGISVDTKQIHATRVIRFDGGLTTRRRRLMNNSWSESVLQRVYSALKEFNGAYAAVSTLMQEASLRTVGIKDLARMMMADGGNTLRQRLTLMDSMTSVARAVLYDKDLESVDRTEVAALSGLADMLRMYILFLAGAMHIPVTVLMGQAPAGLNATGDSDVRLFYDRIDSDRLIYLKPRLIRLAKVICACDDGPTSGVIPRIDVVFPSMYASTPAEEADIKLKTAQTDAIYLTNGVVTPEECGTSRFPSTGWSADTTIELDDRDLTKAANEAGEVDENGEPIEPPADASTAADAALNGAQIAAMQAIIVAVAARQIPRESGVQLVKLSVPSLTAERAETLMGDTGKGTFTAPAPELEAKHAALQDSFSKLQRSHTSTKVMLGRAIKGGFKPIERKGDDEGRGDDTDEDVAAGADAESQAKPMPEGPPYTGGDAVLDAADAERFDAGFTSRTPDAHGGLTYTHGETAAHPAGHEVVKPRLRATTYRPAERGENNTEVRGAEREIKAAGDYGIQRGRHGMYDIVHTPSGLIATGAGSKAEAEALATHLHERVPHSEEPNHAQIGQAKASFSFNGKDAVHAPGRVGTPAHDVAAAAANNVSHAATEASERAMEKNTPASHGEARDAHLAAAEAHRAIGAQYKSKEHEAAAKQHERGAADAVSREAHETQGVHAINEKNPTKLREAAVSHEAVRDKHLAAAAGQKAVSGIAAHHVIAKHEAAAASHGEIAKEYHALAAKHSGGGGPGQQHDPDNGQFT